MTVKMVAVNTVTVMTEKGQVSHKPGTEFEIDAARADELEALLAADNASPGVTMAALPELGEIPADARRTPFSPLGFRFGGGDPDAAIRASEGRLRVQDEGSQLAALALTRARPVAEGERWLDLCAGPGGKAALLAAIAAQRGARLVANERQSHRAALVHSAMRAVPGVVEVELV